MLRLYDERLPPEPTYPSVKPSEADFGSQDERFSNGEHHERCRFAPGDDINHGPPGSATCMLIQLEHEANQTIMV